MRILLHFLDEMYLEELSLLFHVEQIQGKYQIADTCLFFFWTEDNRIMHDLFSKSTLTFLF